MEKCGKCGKKLDFYKDAIGDTIITCFRCFPMNDIAIKTEELSLCKRSQYPQKLRYIFTTRYKEIKITIL